MPSWNEVGIALGVLCAIVTAASAAVAMLPAPTPGSRWAKARRLLEFLALMIGNARQQGLVLPSDEATQAAINLVRGLATAKR